MKKKIFITLAVLVLLACTSAVCFAVAMMNSPKHPSEYKIGIKYEQALQSDKPMLTVFYVDWCGYCLRFMPKFNILSKLYKDKFNFVMVDVEDKENTSLANDLGIAGFPTVYILDPKYDNRLLLNNALYLDKPSLKTELERYLRIRSLLDKGAECIQGK